MKKGPAGGLGGTAMKPVYCNTASITNNKKSGEVSISFTHIYNEHKMSVAGGA